MKSTRRLVCELVIGLILGGIFGYFILTKCTTVECVTELNKAIVLMAG